MKRTDYDRWWCDRCQREWTVQAVPHQPMCPICGHSGWWRRTEKGEEYDTEQ